MKKRMIAVDDKLDNVKQALTAEGFQVKGLTDGLGDAQAVIVSGLDDNFLGHQEVSTQAPVIDAAGMSVEDILHEVRRATENTKLRL